MLRRHKSLTIVMTLCLCLALLAPVFVAPQAVQAATVSASGTPVVSKTNGQILGSLIFDFGVINAGYHTAVIKLPTSFTVVGSSVSDMCGQNCLARTHINAVAPANFGLAGGPAIEYNLAALSANQLQLSLYSYALYQDAKIGVSLTNVNVPNSAEATINATIIKLAGDFSDGLVAVGKTTTGAVDILRTDPPTVAAGSPAIMSPAMPDPPAVGSVVASGQTTKHLVQIHVREDSNRALATGADVLKFKLPRGVTWTSAAVTMFPGTTQASLSGVGGSFSVDRSDTSLLKITRNNYNDEPATGGATFTINAMIAIDADEAVFGDINATVLGSATSNMSEVKLCSYQDFGYTLTASAPETKLTAGRTGMVISNITLKENQAASLLNGRTITMTLPDGVYWKDAAANSYLSTKNSGFGVLTFNQSASDPAKLTGSVNGTTASKGEMNFEKFAVDVAPDFTGDITIQFSGSAGITDKLVVGKVTAPVSATAESKDVMIGVKDQTTGNIVITEGFVGAINSRTDGTINAVHSLANRIVPATQTNLILDAPLGVSWAKVPTVKVAEGDISLGTPVIGWSANGRNHQLTIPIKSTSTKVSKIEISDIAYDVDRTVPEGNLEISIGGDAVAETAGAWDGWANRDSAASVVAAKVITPHPDEGTTGAAVGQFKISSNIYEVNGVAKVMDAAPYIKNGRTYVPVRFLGYALGLADADIVWDEATQKVTMTKGDNVIELTIGSTTITVNGEAKTMDVAPEISNGRTMLPARYVAEGLGYVVGWDPGSQTVLISK